MPPLIPTTEPPETAKRLIQQALIAEGVQTAANLNRLITIVFNSKTLTAQEVVDLLATDAAELFEIIEDMQVLITKLRPDAAPIVLPKAVIRNQDGTVTIQE